jgi:deoxyribose-phosphate aldolase
MTPLPPAATSHHSRHSSPSVDAVMVAERAASFTKRSIKATSKMAGLKLALSMLDLTTLEGKDSPEKARSLCRKALRPSETDASLPSVAAVCVYPSLVPVCVEELGDAATRRVKIASVATGFPSGQYPLDVRIEDVRQAVAAGADEIDMVISRGLFLAGKLDVVAEEIRQTKVACRRPNPGPNGGSFAHLKVILETGELETLDNVRVASDLAIRAMAEIDDHFNIPAPGTPDFIKTSTGKVQPAATMPVTLVMLEAIRDWYLKTGRKIGMKPAGGIRTAKQALHYLVMVNETLGCLPAASDADDLAGSAWLTPDYFRFGASTLANDILRQIAKQTGGRYMANFDFSEA